MADNAHQNGCTVVDTLLNQFIPILRGVSIMALLPFFTSPSCGDPCFDLSVVVSLQGFLERSRDFREKDALKDKVRHCKCYLAAPAVVYLLNHFKSGPKIEFLKFTLEVEYIIIMMMIHVCFDCKCPTIHVHVLEVVRWAGILN